jgi:hypothetical protein
MAQRDPEGWKQRAKAEPMRRLVLKAAIATVAVLSNLDGTLNFIARFLPRPAPGPTAATPAPSTALAPMVLAAEGRVEARATVVGVGGVAVEAPAPAVPWPVAGASTANTL